MVQYITFLKVALPNVVKVFISKDEPLSYAIVVRFAQ